MANHVVFGAGLIGGFVYGGLSGAGYNARLIGRQKTKAALANGLKLTDYLGNELSLPAPEFVEPSSEAKVDYLWLSVKCTAVESALDEMAELISDNTIIVCCQNGFGSDRAVRERFKRNTVLGALIGYNVAEPADGHLHRSTEGVLYLQQHPTLDSLVPKLNTNLFPCDSADDFVAYQWAKLQLNLANPVNALADIPVKAMLEQRGFRRIVVALQKELIAVTDAQGIELPKLTQLPPKMLPKVLNVPDFIFKILGQKMLTIDPTARLSMWWDMHNGKPTEIDYLNQSVVAAGKQTGVPTPFNERIVSLIHQVEHGELETGISADQLWQLLQH